MTFKTPRDVEIPKPRDRRSKFTPERCEIILRAVMEGNYLGTAARLAGIDPNTLATWLHHYSVPDSRPDWEDYARFKEAIEEADAHGEHALVRKLQDASLEPRNWTAAAWLLERKFPSRWSRNDRSEVNITGNVQHNIDVRTKIDHQLAVIANRQREEDSTRQLDRGGDE